MQTTSLSEVDRVNFFINNPVNVLASCCFTKEHRCNNIKNIVTISESKSKKVFVKDRLNRSSRTKKGKTCIPEEFVRNNIVVEDGRSLIFYGKYTICCCCRYPCIIEYSIFQGYVCRDCKEYFPEIEFYYYSILRSGNLVYKQYCIKENIDTEGMSKFEKEISRNSYYSTRAMINAVLKDVVSKFL